MVGHDGLIHASRIGVRGDDASAQPRRTWKRKRPPDRFEPCDWCGTRTRWGLRDEGAPTCLPCFVKLMDTGALEKTTKGQPVNGRISQVPDVPASPPPREMQKGAD